MAHELLLGQPIVKAIGKKTHHVGAHVPKGGSMCGNCAYGDPAKQVCKNEDYKNAVGTDKFVDPKTGKIVPGDEFCCDFWERK